MLALTFQIGADRMAIDVRRVRRVVPRVRLETVVSGSAGVAGRFVYRGQVVPVIDLFRLSGAGECPSRLSTRIILVPFPDGSDRLVGFLASQVAEIRELPTPPVKSGDDRGLGPTIADGAAVIRFLNADQLLENLDLNASLFARPGGTGP